jgi:hypothetical protein
VPGGRKTFIGTPHTHNSIYDEQIDGGAAVLRIPLFEHSQRFADPGTRTRFELEFTPPREGVTVLTGIGPFAKMLKAGRDYRLEGRAIVFGSPPGVAFDVCAGNAWPERFTAEEVLFKRRQCRTFNAWDSQYQLHSKPVSEVRLDPARIIPYAAQPEIRIVNNQVAMFLGSARIVGASAWWDCSLGKLKSDASAFCLVLTDEAGRLYWHVAAGLTGELAEFDQRDERIVGGQVVQIRDYVQRFQIPRVDVETNGPGGFVPPILRRALKGSGCGVGEEFSVVDKRKRILDAIEPPLSSRFLWAHVDVLNGPVWDQMQDFNPMVREQPDDYLDAGAGAIAKTPVRIGKIIGAVTPAHGALQDWRPSAGVHEVELDLS